MTKIFTITIRLDEKLRDELDKLTTDIGVNQSWFIRKAITEKIERANKKL